MKKGVAAASALILLAGCTAPTVTTTSTPPAASTSPAVSPGSASVQPSGPTEVPSGAPSVPDASAGTPSPTLGPDSSLEAAFAQPENGGIGAFLSRHPDYLPGTVVIGEVVVSGFARGPLDLTLRNVPPGTTRMFMTIACTESVPYRMELTNAAGVAMGASWADSCGYWGGLNGYTTTPFDPASPPARFTITVSPKTRYSYVLYASPGR